MDESNEDAMEVEITGREGGNDSGSICEDEAQLDRRLNEAEEAVCEIMKTTKSTLDELQNVPNCNMERLKEMAKVFVEKVQDMQTNLRDNPYLEPSKKSEDELKLEEKALNRREYEKKVAELEELIGQLHQQDENDNQL